MFAFLRSALVLKPFPRILALRRKALPTETEMLRQHSRIVDKAFEGTDLWVMEEEYPSIHDHSP
jgi:hypothetical protein